LYWDLEIFRNVHECGLDRCCGEGGHHGMECDEDQVDYFLQIAQNGLGIDEQVACLALGPIIRVGIVHTREWFNVQSSMSL
jgi:hypothetical protein